MEDILIPYFPFIIGKHEELVDYVLNRSTVSRLHVRIDREGEEYRITDLNSTNGTMVGRYGLSGLGKSRRTGNRSGVWEIM